MQNKHFFLNFFLQIHSLKDKPIKIFFIKYFIRIHDLGFCSIYRHRNHVKS